MNRKPILYFDYDGTIHDTMRIYKPAVLQVTEELIGSGYEVEVPSDERIASWLGMTAADMWQDFCPDLPRKTRDEAGKKVGAVMTKLTKAGQAVWYQGAEEVLTEFRKRGYSLAVLSNCSVGYAREQWAAFHMERWFSAFYDSESYGWIPKPEILKKITAEEPYPVIMIGDRETDMISGHAAGGNSIGCLYGFGSEEELQTADFLVKNIKELPAAAALLERK